MLTMSSKEGRLIDLKALPLLGVFNFNNLSRRLRLDFSDLFEKGFSFDKAKGRFEFEGGLMQLTEPLVIEGPSAKFKVEGTTDLRRELFNHDVIAVLPVTDSIPVLVTLAGFPQIGIPVYLFNRSFGDMFDRFTSVNYKVTGSWRDPEIKLTSFFKSDDLNKQQRDKPVRRPKR
ncbi:putative exported protein [gamma proteobacterium IMCC2047]|nr:putative exported protein [gamma proteobacterium IMCC2047]